MYPLIKAVSSMFKFHMYDYCNVEGPDVYNDPGRRDHVMVTKDGGLMGMYEIKGKYSFSSDEVFLTELATLFKSLKSSLGKPGFRIELYFTRDPDRSRDAIEPSIRAMKKTAREVGLDELSLIAEERGQVLAKHTNYEKAYLVIRTGLGVLLPGQAKDAVKQRIKEIMDLGVPMKPGEFGQSPFVAIGALRDAHNAFSKLVSSKFSEAVVLRELTVKESIKAMADCISPHCKSEKWSPILQGERFPARELKESKYPEDASHLLAPDIGIQLFDRFPDTSERRGFVRYGDVYQAPLNIDIPPEDPLPIRTLLDNLDETVPFSFKIVIDTGNRLAKKKASGKAGWAGLLAIFNSDNRLISSGAKNMISKLESGASSMGMVQIVARTWGPNLKETSRRKELLMQALQSWGSMEPIEERGDEVQAWLDNVPGLTNKHIANRYPMLLDEGLRLAPLARPTSPWSYGTQIYRTPERKAYPFLPRSSKQTTNNDIYYAPPGFGKSFKLSADNMAFVLTPGQKRLPRIGILDIGYSSASFVQMIQDQLPPNRKHEAISVTYQMSAEYAVNSFDTPLGCRTPLKIQRSFLCSLVTLVLTPASKTDPIERLDEMVGSLVDEMYDYYADHRNPKYYQPGYIQEVDDLLNNIHYHADEETPWWSIVDLLYDKGYHREATLAQRMAVPTLADATEVLNSSESIKSNYGKESANAGQRDLVQFTNTMLQSAMEDFPILSQPTAFDFGNARIISLDLQDVADTGSPKADKQTAIMYMIGRNMLAADFYQSDKILNQFPEKYRRYHEKRIAESSDDIKVLEFDEFHRTSHAPAVREQVIRDMREGRKYGVSIKLLSQMLEDFDAEMISLSTNIYILSLGSSEDDVKKINDVFSPGDDIMSAARGILKGPGPDGSTMIYLATLKGERDPKVSQILYLPMGPIELWAYSTTPEDVGLRSRLSKQVGLGKALTMLAGKYPGGSAKGDIENMIMSKDITKDVAYSDIIRELLH